MKKLAIIGTLLALSVGAVATAEAVTSPSPLNCSIENGACSPLSTVGSLEFSTSGNNLIVTYTPVPAGNKIVGGPQFELNLALAAGTIVNISGTGITGTVPITIGAGGQVDGCGSGGTGCFNFDVGPNVIATNINPPVYTFTLSTTTPLTLASVIPGGALGLDAEVHLGNNGTTGDSVFAAERQAAGVPEPMTLFLLGAGLVGLGASAWKGRG